MGAMMRLLRPDNRRGKTALTAVNRLRADVKFYGLIRVWAALGSSFFTHLLRCVIKDIERNDTEKMQG